MAVRIYLGNPPENIVSNIKSRTSSDNEPVYNSSYSVFKFQDNLTTSIDVDSTPFRGDDIEGSVLIDGVKYKADTDNNTWTILQ